MKTIIVGAGISSLFYAYKHPQDDFVILERSNRIGGRVDWTTLDGIEVPLGAGVGRHPKDTVLHGLLKELKIPTRITRTPASQDSPFIETSLRRIGNHAVHGITFESAGIAALGKADFARFVVATGYSDYKRTDAKVAMVHYGFHDVHGPQSNFKFSWKSLIDALVARVGKDRIRCGEEVTSIECTDAGVVVNTTTSTYPADEVVVGGNADTLHRLFPPKYHKASPFVHLRSQPFMRIYAKMNKPLPVQGGGFYVTSAPFQKIACIEPKKNVYMIAYADNENALILKDKSVTQLERLLHDLFDDETLKILICKKKFWQVGTHYVEPLPPGLSMKTMISRCRAPFPNVKVIGEAVAFNQGWTNSALQTC